MNKLLLMVIFGLLTVLQVPQVSYSQESNPNDEENRINPNSRETIIENISIKSTPDKPIENYQCGNHSISMQNSGETWGDSRSEYFVITDSQGRQFNTPSGLRYGELVCLDLTGDNKPELFVQFWHGGNSKTSYSSYAYLLEDPIKLIFEHHHFVDKFVDLDNDGVKEIASFYPLRYVGGVCGVCFPKIERPFCYKNRRYEECTREWTQDLKTKLARRKQALEESLIIATETPNSPHYDALPGYSGAVIAYGILLNTEKKQLGYLNEKLPPEVFEWVEDTRGDIRKILFASDSKNSGKQQVNRFLNFFSDKKRWLVEKYKNGP